METFKNDSRAFNYSYDKSIPKGSEVILKMPPVLPKKRGVCDIGYAAEDGVELYATISEEPPETALWQKIDEAGEINKTVTFIKIVNGADEAKRVNVRVIME